MRLSLHAHKIEAFLTKYRYKKNSKMRNRERQNPEVPRLLRTLFPDVYPVRTNQLRLEPTRAAVPRPRRAAARTHEQPLNMLAISSRVRARACTGAQAARRPS
jgi:hypothetical protein